MIGRRRFSWLAAILLFSVLARVAVALYLGDVVAAPSSLVDQRSYHGLAVRLVAGHGYSFDRGWYPFTPPETPTAFWSFLYPLFVAAVYAVFGVHPLAGRLTQAVLGGVLLPWMVYRLARRLFSPSPENGTQERAGESGALEGQWLPPLAAGIAAVYGYFVLYAGSLMTETFYIVTLLWSLEVGLRIAHCLQRGEIVSLYLGLELGISLGLAALLRQSILPWVPVMYLYLLWLAWRRGKLSAALRVLAVAGVLLLACIAPFTVRNYVVYDEFLLLNSNTGYAMYSAQHPMHGTNFREFDAAPLPADLPQGNEAQMDRWLMRRGIQFVIDDPGRYLLLSLSRVRAFFEFWPTPDTTLLHNVGRTGSFGVFLPFMVYGIYLSPRRAGFVARNVLLFLFVVFYTLLHLLTWAMVRYRLPVDAALFPLAADAIYALGRRMWNAFGGRRLLAVKE